MIFGALARRYARALLLLADSPARSEKYNENLQAFAQACALAEGQEAPLLSVLTNEQYLPNQRKKLLTAVANRLGLELTVVKFLEFVLDQGRLAAIPEIARFHGEMVDELAGRLRAHVRSAQPLTSEALRKLQEALEKSTGKTIILDSSIDPDLIGGLVTQIGSVVLDGSIQTALAKMRTSLPGIV